MKRLILFFILEIFTNDAAFSNELGNNLFVVEPKSNPILTTSSSRFWKCDGMVNKKLLQIIKSDFTYFSNNLGIKPPGNDCLYNIFNVELTPGKINTYYGVDFYIDKSSMTDCLENDNCGDIRKMTFKISNGKLVKQYLLTHEEMIFKFYCLNLQGQSIDCSHL